MKLGSLCIPLLLLAACARPSAPAPRAPAPGAGVALDPEARRWVEETLASLSTREKAGQLVMPWIGGDYAAVDSPEFEQIAAWVERAGVGGLVISMGLPHSYAAKLNALQRRARVPLLVASDMENGPGMRMAGIYSFPHLLPQGGGTAFPPVMALGAARSEELAYELGRVLGREARAVGVHLAFGPVLDVNSNPLNPIINTRSFGEDPALVARLGTAYIRGAHAEGLLATAKHFPGHGDAATDSHLDLPRLAIDRERLGRVDLPPFRAAVEAGVDAVMTAHVAVTGVEGEDAPPATLSPRFMTQILRDEMGFRGLLFTDAMDMGAVERRYGTTEPLLLALDAGADVLLKPRDPAQAVEVVAAAVESGRIPRERLDASVRRVLEAKARAGVHRERLVDLEAVDERVGIRAHTGRAREVAERALTLVRDRDRTVPLPVGTRRVLSVVWADAGDWVAGRVFEGALRERGLEVLSARLDERSTKQEAADLLARADSAEVVLVSVFVSPREERGSVEAGGGLRGAVEALARSGRPLVALSFGSPYVLAHLPGAPAYLAAYGGQDVSQVAAARALLGEIPIGGRLPVSLPPHHRFGAGEERPARGGGR